MVRSGRSQSLSPELLAYHGGKKAPHCVRLPAGRATDERHSEAEVYRLRGDLLSTLGDLVGAEQEYHQALGIGKRESARP
jgi:hypothetical protein